MNEERPDEGVNGATEDDDGSDEGSTTNGVGTGGSDDGRAHQDAPPGADAQEPVPEDDRVGEEESPSGTPGVPPPADDDRRSPEGLPMTTTTGDPSKDFRGPSVTEEARDEMGADPALDEPGYGDLGHAEDHDILRDD